MTKQESKYVLTMDNMKLLDTLIVEHPSWDGYLTLSFEDDYSSMKLKVTVDQLMEYMRKKIKQSQVDLAPKE